MNQKPTWNELSPAEAAVIERGGTERPFSGKYNAQFKAGAYTCRRCEALLYRSDDKFESHCGWPSFDDEVAGAVTHKPDADGLRTEIVCARCAAHLGHVFTGEGLTDKNVRHCVNSISLAFVSTQRAVLGGGCFWGVEHYLEQLDGVLDAQSGYAGDSIENPSYELICSKTTQFAEVVEVIFDPQKIDYSSVLKRFFEIHDPTQSMRQGPDIGPQYRSVIFYDTEAERAIALALIDQLKKRGFAVATQVSPIDHFWAAEAGHQNYYQRKGTEPYCHFPVDRFK